MRKPLLVLAAALATGTACAEIPLKALQDLPKDAYIPADATFIEGADDETGGVDFTVQSNGKLTDIAANIQAKAQERGWNETGPGNVVAEDSARLEYKKMNGDDLEYSVNYVLLPEGGKTQIEVVFLDERK